MSAYLPPPFVNVQGIMNLRDVGGYRIGAAPSPAVRRNYIYRSADPSRVTDEGMAKLRSLGIELMFDLRSHVELEKSKTRDPPPREQIEGIEWIHTPVFADQDYSPEQIALRYRSYAQGGPEGFVKAYKDILAHGGAAYRRILLQVRDEPQRPFMIHCSAGKDRTGVIVAVMLSLLGVDDETIASEYELTETGMAAERDGIVGHLVEHPALEQNREAAVRMTSAKRENMLAVLKMLRRDFGNANTYVRNICGLKDRDVEDVKGYWDRRSNATSSSSSRKNIDLSKQMLKIRVTITSAGAAILEK
ncbi:MAG: hypothetical protein M1828_000377 [Chrysothrix sp. TS-e1954]|nr:MAG: hypothetical protein M1828_000377 [Chrysothrix sp. TS-e1954]